MTVQNSRREPQKGFKKFLNSSNSNSDLHLLLVDGDPVGGDEPLVSLDVVHPVLQVAVALRQVDLQ